MVRLLVIIILFPCIRIWTHYLLQADFFYINPHFTDILVFYCEIFRQAGYQTQIGHVNS